MTPDSVDPLFFLNHKLELKISNEHLYYESQILNIIGTRFENLSIDYRMATHTVINNFVDIRVNVLANLLAVVGTHHLFSIISVNYSSFNAI